MKLQFIKKMDLRNERGQSAITLALLTITFLLLSGFALDTANMLIKKSHLQRALDAGAVAGITRYASGDASGTIADTARKMAVYNLQEMGISSDNSTVNAAFTTDADQIATLKLTGTINTKTLFMRLIPGAGLSTIITTGSSTARRNAAILSLVIDVSGSMSGSMTALKNAANAFVDSFEDGIDKMALISFADRATVLVPMGLVNKANLHSKINALTSNGYTGTSEAVVLGRKELETAVNPAAVRAMLIFTDGAPNVIRPIFTDANSAFVPKNSPAPPAAPVNYDYFLQLNTAPQPQLHGTSAAMPQVCTNAHTIAQCLNSFSYLDSRNKPGHFAHVTSFASPYTEMKKESYDLAVLESDYAKADNITIYTIGLGTESTVAGDPYQNVEITDRLKPVFLRRLANDPASAADPAFPGLALNNTYPNGTYLQTPNASDLTNLFKSIAQRIKLRLIQ